MCAASSIASPLTAQHSDLTVGQNLPGVFFFYDLSPIKVRNYVGRHLPPWAGAADLTAF